MTIEPEDTATCRTAGVRQVRASSYLDDHVQSPGEDAAFAVVREVLAESSEPAP